MTDVRAMQERLERTFRGAFHVRDIAEALVSFDAQIPAATALERAGRRGFALVGVREGGLLTGYATTEDLEGPRVCGDALRPFEDDEVVAGGTALDEGLRRLAGRIDRALLFGPHPCAPIRRHRKALSGASGGFWRQCERTRSTGRRGDSPLARPGPTTPPSSLLERSGPRTGWGGF